MSTYNPHLEDCYFCQVPFKDGQRVFHWYEHYICSNCVVPGTSVGSHIWREVPTIIESAESLKGKQS